MKKLFFAIGTLALIGAPVMAQSGPVVAPISGESEFVGEGDGKILAYALIAGIAAMGILAIIDEDDDDAPVSP